MIGQIFLLLQMVSKTYWVLEFLNEFPNKKIKSLLNYPIGYNVKRNIGNEDQTNIFGYKSNSKGLFISIASID